jgi:putative thiazole-containing bacteriocin maturation protein
MRPKLKDDTFYIPIEGGVYFRNNEKSFTMKGQTIATWIERLAPYLDGRYDLERLCRSVPAAKQPTVVKLITTLAEQGYIKDVSADRPHTLTPEICRTYAAAIAFIDYHLDSAAYRFEQFLALPVLAIGSGDALIALAHALLETGNRHIHLLDTGEETTDYARIAEYLTALQIDRDPALTLHKLTIADWNDDQALQAALCSFKVVLALNTSGSATFTNRLATLCHRAGVMLVPAVVLGDQMIIGPTHHPDTPGCWQCYWHRRQAALGLPTIDEQGALLATPPVPSAHLGAPAIAISANLLSFEFFKQGTGTSTHSLDGQVFVLDLETLTSATHQVFVHPCCTVCSTSFPAGMKIIRDQATVARDEIQTLQQRNVEMETRQLLQATSRWADAHTGIFTRIDEENYFQLPLIRSQITVPGPSPSGLTTVEAAGLDYAEARLLAVQAAVPSYLESIADPRRALSGTYAQLRAQQDLPHPRHFFGWAEPAFSEEQPIAWLWAAWIANARPVLVPAAAVYPHSHWNQQGNAPLFDPAIPGIGIGASWDEALARGLLAIGAALDDPPIIPTRSIAPAAYTHDSICAVYLKMLDILQAQVTLVDVTGSLGLPRIAAYLDNRLVGVAAHWDTVAAVRNALQDLVLAIQVARFPGPSDHPSPLKRPGKPACAISGNLEPAEMLPPTLAEGTNYREATQVLLDRFHAHGWEPIAANIGIDTIVAMVFGCALRLVVVRQ